MGLIEIKSAIASEIDSRRRELEALSRKIHDNPEIGMSEFKASVWLSEYLEANGFRVERGVGRLPTAFRASYGAGKPVVAFLAEYDALPQIGHACGHNIIATSAAGAGIAAKKAADCYGGTIQVIGTPDEENTGGKGFLIKAGVFSGVDAALMLHPDIYDNAIIVALACQTLDIEFFGKEAHAAAAPEQGVNALAAMLLSFNAIDALRQHVKDKVRIHGVITDGGKAPNIVPAHSAAKFIVRAGDTAYLEIVKEKVLNCFKGAATMTGARFTYRWGEVCYAAMKNNNTLARLFKENMDSLGRRVKISEEGTSFSTDTANVSEVVPALHAMVKIAPLEVKHHTVEFAAAAASEDGMKGLSDGAKALAMTAADLLADAENLESVKKDFAGVGE
jgi:amidohydrolase